MRGYSRDNRMVKRLKSDHRCCWQLGIGNGIDAQSWLRGEVGVSRGCRDKAWVICQCFDSPDHSKHDEGVSSYVRYITCRDNFLNRCFVKLGRTP